MTNDVPDREAEIRAAYAHADMNLDANRPSWNDCASLLDALDREREANRELREAAEFFMEGGMERHSESHWMNEWPERAPEKCEWCRFRTLLHPEDASDGGKA